MERHEADADSGIVFNGTEEEEEEEAEVNATAEAVNATVFIAGTTCDPAVCRCVGCCECLVRSCCCLGARGCGGDMRRRSSSLCLSRSLSVMFLGWKALRGICREVVESGMGAVWVGGGTNARCAALAEREGADGAAVLVVVRGLLSLS